VLERSGLDISANDMLKQKAGNHKLQRSLVGVERESKIKN